MKLPDFNQDKNLLDLRRRMDARRPGHFVLFDAGRHLTGQERATLENRGIITSYEQLRVLPDRTLAIKNGRILVYTVQEDASPGRKYFHLAACEHLQAMYQEKLVATTCQHSPFPLPDSASYRSLRVCPACLHLLAYRGFSLTRNRRLRYSEHLRRHFRLQDFFKVYPLYPVRIEGHL